MKPSIPKGTRDFSPAEMLRRDYIFNTIRTVFKKFGFSPIETPSMELSSTLMGKYGEDGDKLIFRILESGNFLSDYIKDTGSGFDVSSLDVDMPELFNEEWNSKLKAFILKRFQENVEYAKSYKDLSFETKRKEWLKTIHDFVKQNISEKALRYDLTVPFARYVVMHKNEITFPFKRYQIQPVWRADRPQKGRYREFYQCDADVIGSNSVLNEVDLIYLIDDVFNKLGLNVKLKINHRKILNGFVETLGYKERIGELLSIVDEKDKMTEQEFQLLLMKNGFDDFKVTTLFRFLNAKKSTGMLNESLRNLEDYFLKNGSFLEEIQEGFKDLQDIGKRLLNESSNKEYLTVLKNTKVEYDPFLARGLSYYTGAIFEVKVDDERSSFTSSICGGGRYDDLTGIFGLPNMSGVGISFGADRIYDVLEEIGLFPKEASVSTKVLIVNFGGEEIPYALEILRKLRAENISTELYPDAVKMKKQMGYADDRKIPFVILTGSDERNAKEVTIKNMQTGDQQKVSFNEMVAALS